MAGRPVFAPSAVQVLSLHSVDDVKTDAALKLVGQAVAKLQRARARVVVTFDLAIGTNRIGHGLGRAATGYTLTPTVASAAFAHCINETATNPDLEIWIDVIGAAQPRARIEVY